jgi:hypothetical protein
MGMATFVRPKRAVAQRRGPERSRGRRQRGRAPGDASIGRRRGQRPAAVEMAPKRRGEGAALAPDQPEPDGGDAAVAHKLEPACRPAHLGGSGAKEISRRADQDDRDHGLQQRREQREERGALQRAFIGEHVGGDHRLAVTGPRGVKDAIGEAKGDQSRGGAWIAMQRMDLGRHEMGWARLFGQQPAGNPALGPAAPFATPNSEGSRPACGDCRHGGREPERPELSLALSWAGDDGATRHLEAEI